MSEKPTCACGGAPKLIFPCSGGSDVGALADLAARQLTRDGSGKMYCLAGIGGRVSGILASTESAAKILAIDGCPLNCTKKTLEFAGFSGFEHLGLADIGFQKSQSPATPENIAKVAQAAVPKLAG
ncbi:MAG TPA: putative zinc-binding protein [Kiritimatiellia bacterium]|nr:putative zinc-binding protein [Kiritimatiellia bacterium]HRT04398.1 putative zinc-binding protein [Kiritimatiellia bacterium]